MPETATRKAVVTTETVREALVKYLETRKTIGFEDGKYEFDKGARGKGFALYNEKGEVVVFFETKENALVFFTRWTEVANEILAKQNEVKDVKTPAKTPAKTAAKDPENVTA